MTKFNDLFDYDAELGILKWKNRVFKGLQAPLIYAVLLNPRRGDGIQDMQVSQRGQKETVAIPFT
ncbi:TPA: hypothetical protein ACGTF0_004262 [Salmonella enterica]|nr:hypothetical protein [Salmonella enterica subsp. diarizonae serovar 61:l,v:z35]HCT3102585.1 hypothetical protein [Salmonella enterica subsp. diarizonae serovar 61:l,v:z35]